MTRVDPHLEPCPPGPPGAHWDGSGIDFALFSRHGERVELCLFDARGERELARLPMPSRTGDTWHGRLEGAAPGLVYGYRVAGPYQPTQGHRFNPHKLLLDPHARELVGTLRWHDAVHGWTVGHPDADLSFDTRDSAPYVPKGRVIAPMGAGRTARASDRPPRPAPPRHAWRDTVVYELHVRGYTQLNPQVPAPLRGRIEALAQPPVIEHLKRLGVTTVELLPVAAWADEHGLVERGLTNFWGYNPLSFFALQPTLARGGLQAFVDTVDALHRAGIEVLLDVVFNHTAEGNEFGPTLSLRGLDNAVYYRLDPQDRRRYQDFTGCGNTLAAHEPAASALVVDALRWWAGEVGVDGFRFDLASAIARDASGAFDPSAPWIAQALADPMLSRCKLVSESWDCTASGHRVGGFPAGFVEWNDRFRDAVRRFWRDGDPPDFLSPGADTFADPPHRPSHGGVADLATRLAGSQDLFGAPGRGPLAGLAFVTAHDGFTLADLVGYRHKHNEANGEGNRDGSDANHSDHCGVEGPTNDPQVLHRRLRRMRALLATLMLSRSVPMLRGGDEFGASQQGNNNAYCQDNAIGWVHWPGGPAADVLPSPVGAIDLSGFIGRLAALRRALPVLRDEAFPQGRPRADSRHGLPDLGWLREDATPMREADWHDPQRHHVAMLLDGADHLAWVAFNAGPLEQRFALPAPPPGLAWHTVLDTSDEKANSPSHPQAGGMGHAAAVPAGGALRVPSQSVLACVATTPVFDPNDASP
jgi:pullulanase/glycogen debranching enzyme